ncbi:MAG: hypothetical protein GY862_25235 [Gammaproteobacteria bacterium]|nr:hypothetical protein [Gammaproteobacteria bacterium]
MSDAPVRTHQPSALDKHLQEKFAEDIVKQSERLDELAKQLFTLELAIPGLYVGILKLASGSKLLPSGAMPLWVPFMFWMLALLATLTGLFPLRYRVNPEVIRRPEQETGFWQGMLQWLARQNRDGELSIEGFYRRSARDKRYALLLGSLCFFAGIAAMALELGIRN